jgi:hypothetical protein
MLPLQTESVKWKTRRFSSIRLLFAHCANGSLLFLRLFTKKQTEVIRLQMDLIDWSIYAPYSGND